MPEKRNRITLDDILKKFAEFKEIQLNDVEIEAETLELWLPAMAQAILPSLAQKLAPPTPKIAPKPEIPTSIIETDFTPPVMEYPGEVVEVVFGATKAEGGTRSHTFTLGGEKTPPFYFFEKPTPHPPLVTADVFDLRIPLAKAIRVHMEEVMDDPGEWAKLYVDKYGADMITIHLISTDPAVKDTSPNEAAKVVEEVLQAVKVPIIIGGSGSPEKDPLVLAKAAEVSEGERVMLNSATLDVYKPIAEAAKKHNHLVLSWTSIDINQQKELNRKLLDYVPKEQIVIDPTTAALGYGLEYAFTVIERMRLAALLGDAELQMPISCGTTNAWAAREAWKKAPELGPREFRGPIWEAITALTLLLAGGDLFMMMHPAAIKTVKDVTTWATGKRKKDPDYFTRWVDLKIEG